MSVPVENIFFNERYAIYGVFPKNRADLDKLLR
jgi:hypothetical protein